MYTELELHSVLTRLLALPAETEMVEFKRAENSFSDHELGEYFSALSNEANLHEISEAWLVFGVDNKSHVVLGTNYKSSRPSLDEMKKKIADQTTNRITFDEIYEINHEGKRVLMFLIPAAPQGFPIAYKGHYYGRDGESICALNIHEIEKIRLQHPFDTYELQIAQSNLTKQGVLDALNYKKFFELLGKEVPQTLDAIIAIMTDYGYVVEKGANYDITNLGALLLANNLTMFPGLENRRVIVRKYSGTNNRSLSLEQIGTYGYAVGFEGLIDFISRNTSVETIETLREYIPAYPKVAIREFVANAIVHQDFDVQGMPITIEIFTNRLVITNPGESLNKVERWIDLPPKSRNEKLAQSLHLFNLCERRGSGVDRAVAALEQMQLPGYTVESGNGFTRTTFYPKKAVDEMTKEERVLACYQHTCLLYEDRMTVNNQSIRERFGLGKNKSAMASHIISDTVEAGLIKVSNPDGMSRKYTTYIPYYG